MKKRVNLVTVAVLMVLMAVVTYIVTYYYVQESLNQKLDMFSEQQRDISVFLEARDRILGSYVGPINEEALAEGAIKGMVDSLGDQWSAYMNTDNFTAYNSQKKNQYVGIGVTVELSTRKEGLLVSEVVPGSPAEEAGISVGDVITKVDGEEVPVIGEHVASERILGEEYTLVSITFLSGEEEITSDIMRRTINKEIVTSRIIGTAGYVRVANFNSRVDEDFIAAVGELTNAGVESLVIDMRSNPGGSLDVLHRMLDYLLPEGLIITLRYRNGVTDIRESDANCIELPMVVLVNDSSYSAAEFFAACLREYDWADIVGEKTSGKGYAQETFAMTDGSGLLLSTSEYFPPSGISLAGVGLTPDYEIPLSASEKAMLFTLEPEHDKQLQKALQILGVVS